MNNAAEPVTQTVEVAPLNQGTAEAVSHAVSKEGAREDHRLAILERGSLAVGQTWAMNVVGAFNAEQRAPTGGWPATLSEARGQVEFGLTTWLRRHGYSPLKPAEASQAIRWVYAAARREWLARRMPEPRT